jgi:hypothetical protein
LDTLVAPLENNQLIPGADKGDWLIAKDLIKQVYDISIDDNALRAAAMDTRSKQTTIGKDFDSLRKYYRQRREFHNYRVQLPVGASAELKSWLAVLGFHCV